VIVSTGYIYTGRGIVAVQATAQTFQNAGKQIADDIGSSVAGTESQGMTALELVDAAKTSIELARSRDPALESIKVIGSIALGTAATAALAPLFGVSVAGLATGAAVGWVAGKVYDWVWDAARTLGDSWWHLHDQVYPPGYIDMSVSDRWRQATAPVARDPLAIDLDNDGIETAGIPTSGNPILFDHDANGVKTGTGWLKGDDAWLVLDRDANGSIDCGRELFGVDTVITVTEMLNGPDGVPYVVTHTRNATSGFEALSTLDANGDNVFNAQDAAFSQVRLWRDLNQNGISDAGELVTLAQANITGISLNVTNTNTDLGNGNSVTGTAVVTRSTGGNTLAETVNLSASNLNLGNNPFYRQFTNQIPLTEQVRGLPGMGGSGALRDLREAMSLGTAEAQSLTAAVASLVQGSTRTSSAACSAGCWKTGRRPRVARWPTNKLTI
jgi:hypothetical protein